MVPAAACLLWPLIWVQVLMLRAQIRAAYGRGVKYRWSVTPISASIWSGSTGCRDRRKRTRSETCHTCLKDRLAAACDGRAAAPAYSVQFGNDHDSGDMLAIRRFALRRVLNLPVPET
jgi:hypothetical protein